MSDDDILQHLDDYVSHTAGLLLRVSRSPETWRGKLDDVEVVDVQEWATEDHHETAREALARHFAAKESRTTLAKDIEQIRRVPAPPVAASEPIEQIMQLVREAIWDALGVVPDGYPNFTVLGDNRRFVAVRDAVERLAAPLPLSQRPACVEAAAAWMVAETRTGPADGIARGVLEAAERAALRGTEGGRDG